MDWSAFFSAFGLVFVAELGDKTQLAVVTQTCKHRRPWAVFLGASGALVGVTALGAIGGQVLGHLVPAHVLRVAAGLAFVAMGQLMVREASQGGEGSWRETLCEARCDDSGTAGASLVAWDWHAFSATFGLLFLAELGDKTQLAVLSLSSEHGDAWAVLAGGALALTLVTAVGVVGGRALCKLVSQRLLLWVSAAAFMVMGALMIFGVL